MDNLPRHDNGALDARYSVTREYTGAPWPQYVVRFCGDWVGNADTPEDASALAADHARQRQGETQ